MTADFVRMERVFGVHFENPALSKEAMTHKSYAAEHNIPYDNQRLELLGDAVVQIILTRYLFDRYPTLQEGDLTKIRSSLANQDALALFARSVSLGSFLLLGKGEIELHGNDRDSTLSDAFESYLGALYLDQGLPAAETFLLNILKKQCPDPRVALEHLNPKGALQERTQRAGIGVPKYRVLSVTGPDHDPVYTVELSLGEHILCTASASSRKAAERKAAQQALEQYHQPESAATRAKPPEGEE